MKLLSCRIENFGNLHEKQFDFTKNPTVIFEKNGWGKSTFAAFLKCMFYGMPDSRVKSAEGNVRLKYKPWQGGVYGGSLTFEKEGKRYVVQRTFGDTPKGDESKLYDALTWLPCDDFSIRQEGLGEALFGVDEEGYDKLVYLPQGSVESRLDGGLQAALLRSRESLEGGEDVERAVERIETEEKLLRAKRKPAKGRLDVLDEEIFALEEALISAEQSSAHAQVLQKKIADIDSQIERQKEGNISKRTALKKKKKLPFILGCAVGVVALILGATSLLPMPLAIALLCVGVGSGLAISLLTNGKEEDVSSLEPLLQQRHALILEGQTPFAAVQSLPALKERLARCRAEKGELEKRAWRLATAKNLLLQAKRQTAGGCLQPLTERCQRLFAEFYPGKRTVLTAEGEMRLDEAGALREGAYYSAGMRAALGICIRLALIENLFERETPPLILDDPFVDMDEENLRLAKTFLRALQVRYQIVYLTCHESRLL